MVTLSDLKRTEYERFSPTFWRKAEGASEKQTVFFQALLQQPNVAVFVSEESTEMDGFIIVKVFPPPPVYNPGKYVSMVDDFVVREPEQWATFGVALLTAAREWAEEQGASLSVVVCGHQDEPKRAMLRNLGFSLASEWYVNPA